jgi:hypothetical protein
MSCHPISPALPPCIGSLNIPSMVCVRQHPKKYRAFDRPESFLLLGFVDAGKVLAELPQAIVINLLRSRFALIAVLRD